MKSIPQVILAICLFSIASCKDTKRVSVTVVEENGAPIEGADVHVAYIGYTPKDGPSIKGKSDKLGKFVANGHAPLRMKVMVDKKGYYPSVIKKLSRLKDHDLKIVLRKKKNARSLYARRYRGKVPSVGKNYGFDFMVGDWVVPHGKGKISDILVKVKWKKDVQGVNTGYLTISFPDELGGIYEVNSLNGYVINSKLVMPHVAPKKGYVNHIDRVESGYENKNKPKDTSYFFRTRAKEIDANQYIFNYTKFQNGINFSMNGGVFIEEAYRKKNPKEYGFLSFTYYFNPNPNDRNLEFNPTENLFKNLDSDDDVHQP